MRGWMAVLLVVALMGCGESYRPVKTESSQVPAHDSTNGSTTDDGHMSQQTAGGAVDLASIRLSAPETWVRKPPRSEFVSAEFALPRAEGDSADGRLTVSTAGGSIEANIARWRGQFGDKAKSDSQEELSIAGTTVTVVDLSGTYNDQPRPFAPGVQREGYRMLAAIIPVGERLHFVKAYGPENTVALHAESFRDFLQSIDVKE